MAVAKPNRRILVTALNTALATAAVTATAAGWATLGMADTSGAPVAAAAQAEPLLRQESSAAQQAPPDQQLFAPRRHHHGEHESREGFSFGPSDGAGQRQAPALDSPSAQERAPAAGSGQSQAPSFSSPSTEGSTQPRQPITSSRSSR